MPKVKLPFNPLLALLALPATLFFIFPLIGLIAGAPWGHIVSVITSEAALQALELSIIASLSSTAIALAFGFPLTLTLIWPSLAAGLVLTWVRALGEFGATITFAGNLPGVTQTMPLAIYISQSSNQTDEAIALSLILVVVSLVVMIFRRDRSGAG
jgi:molybdate transport system permease protein